MNNELSSMTFELTDTFGVVLVFAPNGVKAGEILMMEDGYYQFWPEMKQGYWPTWVMRQIADKVDSMNKEWDAKLRTELGELTRETNNAT